MISFLQGIVVSRREGRVEIEVGGVGFEVLVSRRTLADLPSEGERVRLRTWLHVREDVLQLYGFLDEEERRTFQWLLEVPGVGPKAALAVLSKLAPQALAEAVGLGDPALLKGIPGVGPKTVQQILLSLKSKWEQRGKRLREESSGEKELPGGSLEHWEAALQGLLQLGLSGREAQDALREARGKLSKNASLEEWIREALKCHGREVRAWNK